jgi:hypothetical protein
VAAVALAARRVLFLVDLVLQGKVMQVVLDKLTHLHTEVQVVVAVRLRLVQTATEVELVGQAVLERLLQLVDHLSHTQAAVAAQQRPLLAQAVQVAVAQEAHRVLERLELPILVAVAVVDGEEVQMAATVVLVL